MIERKEVKELVVATLRSSDAPLRAVSLYSMLREEHKGLFREERVRSFKGFVKVINEIDSVENAGSGVKLYFYKG